MNMVTGEKSSAHMETDKLIAVLLTESHRLYRSMEVSRLLFDPHEAPLEHQALALSLEEWMRTKMSINVSGEGFSPSYSGQVWQSLMSRDQLKRLSSRLANEERDITDQLSRYIRMEKTRTTISQKLGFGREHLEGDMALVCNGFLSLIARLDGDAPTGKEPKIEVPPEQKAKSDSVARPPSESISFEIIGRRNTDQKSTKRLTSILLKVGGLVGLAAVIAVAFLLANLSNRTFDVLRKEGLGEADRYLEKIVNKGSLNKDELYKAAWISYRKGETQRSEELVGRILEDGKASPKMEGDCYYLLGNILMMNGNFEDSLSRFALSGKIYASENLLESSYVNSVSMARAYTKLKNYDLAHRHLDKARDFHERSSKKNTNLSTYYSVHATLSSALGEYDKAIDYELKRVQIYSMLDNQDALADALSSLGYLYLRVGDMSRAYDFTLDAQDIIHRLIDRRKYFLNQINFVGIMKCQGIDPTRLIGSIEEWADSHEDSELKQYLEEVQAICQVGGNNEAVE